MSTLAISISALIGSHPRGLGLGIAEGGRGLSGGQRMLTLLTRFLLLDPRIMLLDEPTSNLDQSTEARVLQHIMTIRPKTLSRKFRSSRPTRKTHRRQLKR
ncbi:MAG: hypothetical protein DI637_01800 [Citromicrobium sp.]|nr:MAG: hypothetical protein DI637_01800 [Citromicrobium sp.]